MTTSVRLWRTLEKKLCKKDLTGDRVGFINKLFPPVWVIKLQRAVWANEKAGSRQIGASSDLMSLGFFGLLRNLRSAMRTGPDFGV